MDLDEIWDYTAAKWNTEQAERYTRQLRVAVELIAADPTRGQPCDELRPGYFKFATGSHILFCRRSGKKIDVVRILHNRMDFQRHL